METKKRTSRHISGRLLKALSASEAEREIEDLITTDPDQEIPVDPYVESAEGVVQGEMPATQESMEIARDQ